MLLLKPSNWVEYELLDSGGYKKLERFGKYILSRPEPQAVWDTSLSEREWNDLSSAVFSKEAKSEDKGTWMVGKGMPGQWYLPYGKQELKLTFRLGLSSFKHVGIFPEQAANWEYIYQKSLKMQGNCKVLNLFAYTGGASLAAKAAGADVVHVDSVKQVINWGNDNMAASNLKDIRWVVEDAFKFVEREVKRGKKYQGIILDPPSYGRGPNGEKWVIEELLNPLLKMCKDLLDTENHFFILNLYSMGFSTLIQETLIKSIFPKVTNPEMGELFLEDKFSKKLPLGTFYRFSNL